MQRQYLKSKTVKVELENIQLVYHLFFSNTYYSIECFKEGYDEQEPDNYFLAEDFTDDEGEAEDFLSQLAKGKVFPIHIKDMVDDYLTMNV
ncbi:MAG: hypothetical protein E7255_03625 [Lachnospiraceae bacterium]|nr:hypothetical protein [Lachnospiraceae bacterium]